MKKSKSLLLLLTLVLAVGTLLAACGSNGANSSAGNGGNNATSDSGNSGEEKLAADQTLRLNAAADVPTFDPAQAQDNQAHLALSLTYEGLARLEGNKEVPGVAEKWEVSPDGLTYTFYLRKDAKWSNGDSVTANDFAFGWERVLSPQTKPAPPYAYQLYYLKNAEQYNKGEITDFSQVGVKVVDDYTLQVELNNPTPYFVNLTAFYTFFPVHSSVKGNDKWSTDPNTMITNGPFVLKTRTPGQSMEFVKNDQYWAKDEVKLNTIKFTIVNSGATEVLSYRNGELDRAGQPNGNIPADQIPILKQELPNELALPTVANVYYYEFNTEAEPFTNAKIRKAFAKSISRQDIVDKVTLGGQVPAYAFVPPGMNGVDDEFRNERGNELFTENVEEAKKLLQEGMQEEGYTSLPEITLIYNTDDNHKKVATAIADMWKQNLGVDVKLENQEWGVYLDNRTNGNFQIARAGWVPDYNDPMTFIDMWTTNSGNNKINLKNEEYDKLVADTYKEADNQKRMDNMARAEEILIKEEMGIMPIYYYVQPSLTKTYLKGITMDYSGAVYYDRAYLLEH